ncbi:MAG: hypothetical protein ACRDYY_06985 [Acidimicrobiales bacterium]
MAASHLRAGPDERGGLVDVPASWANGYPLLKLHSEANRTVAVTALC